jgi:ABC-2 type transport system permease protein
MQLLALVDGPEAARRLLMTSAFNAWHGLLTEPPYHRPLVDAATIGVAYVVVFLAGAYRVLRRRDIGA